MRRLTLALALSTLPAAIAHAQPAPAPPSASNDVRARALFKEGVRLGKLGQHGDALALFLDAYALVPNVNILFNIGETQRALGLHLEAAATYQRIVDDPAQPAALVTRAQAGVVEADRSLARLTLEITTTDATPVEISIDNGAWLLLPADRLVRVVPGVRVVRARGGGVPIIAEATLEAVAGTAVSVPLRLIVDQPPPIVITPPSHVAPTPPPEVRREVGPTLPPIGPSVEQPHPSRPPGRFGGLVHVIVSSELDGLTAAAGATFAPLPRLTLSLGGMVGGNLAGFATATYAVLPGKLRPTVTAGGIVARHAHELDGGSEPLYPAMSVEILVGFHGAVGGEWILSRRLSAIADVAIDHYPSAGALTRATSITPMLGLHARL